MGALLGALRAGIEVILIPVDWLGPFWGLTLLSIVVGVLILYTVAWTTPQRRVDRARSLMASSIYEIRLFLDSPKRVIISIGRLLVSSFLYIAYMMPAFVLMSVPLWLFYLHLEPRYGLDALPAGLPLVVEVEPAPGVSPEEISVEGEGELEISAPPLFAADKNRLYVRVVPRTAAVHTLRIRSAGSEVVKEIVADGAAHAEPERASGADLLESVGTEPRLDPDRDHLRSISISHPSSHRRWLGLEMPWWLYALGLVTVAALVLKGPLGVVL